MCFFLILYFLFRFCLSMLFSIVANFGTHQLYLEIQLHTLFANNRVLNRMSLPILGNFCTRLSEMLEAKKARIPFWNNLSISNIITATLCYLISKCFPAESVPRCMSSLFSTVPFTNQKTGSVYQCRG